MTTQPTQPYALQAQEDKAAELERQAYLEESHLESFQFGVRRSSNEESGH